MSSKLKALADQSCSGEDLNDSGFLPVLHYLRNILIPPRTGFSLQTVRILSDEVAREGQALVNHLTVARETDRNKLGMYKKALTRVQQVVQRWESDQWRKGLR